MPYENLLTPVDSSSTASSIHLCRHRTLVICALLLFSLLAPASAQGGCIARYSGAHYLRLPSSGFLSGAYTPYSDASCSTELESSSTYQFDDGIVRASDASSAIRRCEDHGPADEYVVVRWVYDEPNIWFCGPVRENKGGDSSRSSESHRPVQIVVGKKPDGALTRAFFTDRENLPLSGLQLNAIDGLNSGIQFRRLDAGGIGIQEVLDMGFIDAVDVWGNVGSGFSVCFPQAGPHRLPRCRHFASHIDREIDNVIDDGGPCAAMDRAGTMVLVSGSGSGTAQATTITTTRRPGTDDSIADAIPLEGCTVTTLVNLRLREEPWGVILDVIPRDSRVARSSAHTILVPLGL